jgi:hypothetical protein
MFYACVESFNVMDVRGNILGWDGKVNKAIAGGAGGAADNVVAGEAA